MIKTGIWLKAEILHYGMKLSKNAINNFGLPYLSKRRFYSNYDDNSFFSIDVPQEIIFPEYGIVSTAIFKEDSPWTLEFENGVYFLINDKDFFTKYMVTFPICPPFYGKKMQNGDNVESYITKLFNHSIGVFANTRCFFAEQKMSCKFCSIMYNQGRPNDVKTKINESNILEAIEIALQYDSNIDDIFISGGVFTGEYDKNFGFYANLALKIKELINKMKLNIEVTLNTYPPETLDLIDSLKGSGISIMLSLESINDEYRKYICPGKSNLINKLGVENILKKCVSILGKNHVLAFVIEGLEDINTIIQGVEYYASLGVCLIVHVLHVDPGTWVHSQGLSVPSVDEIIKTAIDDIQDLFRIFVQTALEGYLKYEPD